MHHVSKYMKSLVIKTFAHMANEFTLFSLSLSLTHSHAHIDVKNKNIAYSNRVADYFDAAARKVYKQIRTHK